MIVRDLQYKNGNFAIAAFDQHSSLVEMLGVDPENADAKQHISELKTEMMKMFSPICSAVLIDPDFGMQTLAYKDPKAGLLMSLEKSSYEKTDPDDMPLFREGWGVEEIAAQGAAVKFVLMYNPLSKNAKAKREIVENIFRKCSERHVPFLLEPILHPLTADSKESFAALYMDLQLRMVRELENICHTLKLEFPIVPGSELSEDDAAEHCRKVTRESSVPWIVLSRGMAYEKFIRAIEIAMQNGAKGFAVGRAVWKELTKLPTKEEQLEFIRTTARERMQKLVELVQLPE